MAVLSAVQAKLWLFYLKGVRGRLSFNVVQEACSYLSDPHFFAAIYRSSMQLYDFNTRKVTNHSLPVYVDSGYVEVDRSTVLVVGKEVLTLDVLTFQITTLAPLLTSRNYVGVAKMGATVFAFGGCGDRGPMKVCEKASFPPQSWTPLPPMHYSRSCFTPCAFKAFLYLASTFSEHHRAVESFSPLSATFTLLPVSLPALLQLGYYSVAFVANGELILLSANEQMACWGIESEAQFIVAGLDRGCCSLRPPLIVGTEVYIANFKGGKVEKWSLETGSFKSS